MKRCHVINKQEENYWAELYSAEWKGIEIGIEKGKVMMIERLIKGNLYTLEQVAKISRIPLPQIEEIKANMNKTTR